MQYAARAHFSGTAAQAVDLAVKLPWIYIIACPRERVVYVGETFDSGGLVVRLSSHFGSYNRSTLRQAAFRHAGVTVLQSPFIVVAALLPMDDSRATFDGASKAVRVLIEARVQEQVARFALKRNGWAVVSTGQGTRERDHPDITRASDSIAECFFDAYAFLDGMTPVSPFNLVILVADSGEDSRLDSGDLLNRIEVMLYDKVISGLEVNHGSDWWFSVPQNIRVQCATRREEEAKGEEIPLHAYLTFIDLRTIIEKNWTIFGPLMESISGMQGKRAATRWLVDLNELRRTWAHPIKQRFVPAVSVQSSELQAYLQRLQATAAPRFTTC